MLYDERWNTITQPLDEVGMVMERAATYLERRGVWGQHAYMNNNGLVCAVGALVIGEKGEDHKLEFNTEIYDDERYPLTARAIERLYDYLKERFPMFEGLYDSIEDWNDVYSRKKKDVVSAIREAAKRVV